MTFINVEDLSFRYARGKAPIIDSLSFRMKKGEIAGIAGESGSGKSTLLRLICGLEMPWKGTISIAGKQVVNDRTFVEAEHRGVGMVFQDYALFPHLNVADNIAFGLHKMKRPERNERVSEMLALTKLTELAKRYPHQLSGGQQQRVALARALAPKPSILLMDEPFSSLDSNLKSSIRAELREILLSESMTCLLVSHDQADLLSICDRSIELVQGEKSSELRAIGDF